MKYLFFSLFHKEQKPGKKRRRSPSPPSSESKKKGGKKRLNLLFWSLLCDIYLLPVQERLMLEITVAFFSHFMQFNFA